MQLSENRAAFDSSAVLAFLGDEPGGSAVAAFLGAAAISAVNLSEVAAKLDERGFSVIQIQSMLIGMGMQVVEFDEHQALQAAFMRSQTRRLGLSLGDRACLALAQQLKLPVLTTDRIWRNLDVGIEVRVIR